MKRRCVVCGKNLNVILNKDGTYKGGYYFGKYKLPAGKGSYIKVGVTNLLKKKSGVVRLKGKTKEVEYWECKRCFRD